MKFMAVAGAAVLLYPVAALADAPRVVASIKPIHSLVSAVMGDLGAPSLIVKAGASPHAYTLRPSDAAALENAEIVFWTGRGMELFLDDTLQSLAAEATVVELARSPRIALLPVREGGAYEAHSPGHPGHDHYHEQGHDREHEGDGGPDNHDRRGDVHFWLDPVNAGHMLEAIEAALSAADPGNAAAYAANAAAEAERLVALTAEIEAILAPVRDRPFIVFHDAYQYFERRFGLNAVGSITVTPDTMPGAARIAEIRERLATTSAACVFAEPQFEPAIVETIVEGTGARAAMLDPEGARLTEGPDLYAELLRTVAVSLADCLTAR